MIPIPKNIKLIFLPALNLYYSYIEFSRMEENFPVTFISNNFLILDLNNTNVCFDYSHTETSF